MQLAAAHRYPSVFFLASVVGWPDKWEKIKA
jgi:hypothetical protein